MKAFKYDVLIDEKDICDREQEIAELFKAAQQNKKIVLLAPRRYGKTSLVKNIIGNKIKKSRKKIVIFIDLMGVQSLDSIAARLEFGIINALKRSFSLDVILQKMKDLFKGVALQINIDPLTSVPTISFQRSNDLKKSLLFILQGLCLLSKHHEIMLILDEFQDIKFVNEAEALFRMMLQDLGKAAVFILGSKRHLIDQMLNDEHAPLFHFGDEMHLPSIARKFWPDYFDERLAPKKIFVTNEGLEYILEEMHDVPNAICEVGAWIQENYQNKNFGKNEVIDALNEMVEKKQSYAYRLQQYTEKEAIFLKKFAEMRYVLEPHAVDFLTKLHIAKSSSGKMLKKFLDKGILEYELDKGWRLSDPVFAYYLSHVVV